MTQSATSSCARERRLCWASLVAFILLGGIMVLDRDFITIARESSKKIDEDEKCMSTGVNLSLPAARSRMGRRMLTVESPSVQALKILLRRGTSTVVDRVETLRGPQRRVLVSHLRDISPPGMWPVSDDQDNEFS